MIDSCWKWVGSKRKNLQYILPHLKGNRCFVDVFCGGLNVSINAKDFSHFVINDLDKHLINTYYHMKKNPPVFMYLIEKEFPKIKDKESFNSLRDRFNSNTEYNMDNAVDYLLLNKTCFQGKMILNSERKFCNSFGYRVHKQPGLFYNKVWDVMDFLLENQVSIKNMDFREVVGDDDAVYYCDPPYLNHNKSRYAVKDFSKKDHQDLVECAKESKSRVLISNVYCDETLELYKDAKQIVTYSTKWDFGDTTKSMHKELLAIF